MGLISRMRRQTAVYWAKLATDAHGQPTFDDPVEITCRWEEKKIEFVNAMGEKLTSGALVYVDRDTPIGGMLLLGELTSGFDFDPRAHVGDAWEIRHFERLPNLRNTEILRTVYL